MSDEWERITLDDWYYQGVELFGLEPKGWRFICPSCGHVQALKDFLDLGMKRQQAEQIVGYSCIGSWTRKPLLLMRKGKPAKVSVFMEPDQGAGCMYHGGKEPNISPITLVIEEGRSERPTFGFAPELIP